MAISGPSMNSAATAGIAGSAANVLDLRIDVTKRLSDFQALPCCGHRRDRHVLLVNHGPGKPDKFLCLTGGCRNCGFKLKRKGK